METRSLKNKINPAKLEFQLHNRDLVPDHECSLPKDTNLLIKYINSGLFVQFRRHFRALMMVSQHHPETKSLYKSSAQIRIEQARHLRYFYYTIHPFSAARFFWECIIAVHSLLIFCIIPIQFCFTIEERTTSFLYFKLFIYSFLYVDLILFFLTGYVDKNERRVVLSRKKIAIHYLLTYFIFDFIVIIPVELIIHSLSNYYRLTKEENTYQREKYQYLVLMAFFKFVRLGTMLTYIKRFFKRCGFWTSSLKIFNFILMIFFMILWTTCILNMIGRYLELKEFYLMNTWQRIILSLNIGIKQFLMTQVKHYHGSRLIVVQIVFYVIGLVFSMVILGQILQIHNRTNRNEYEYDNTMKQLMEYMRIKALPRSLEERIVQYMEFKYQKSLYRESDILEKLSNTLKEDVLLHNCKQLVKRVDFFKELPSLMILQLVKKLRNEVYLQNDAIVQAGAQGHAMYFIFTGTVAVYTSTGKEICHLEDGDHFGEIALVVNEPRTASVIAIGECEILRLSRKDFNDVIEPYPEVRNKIRMLALERLEQTLRLKYKTT